MKNNLLAGIVIGLVLGALGGYILAYSNLGMLRHLIYRWTTHEENCPLINRICPDGLQPRSGPDCTQLCTGE